MSDNVIIFGAGASRDAGIPLMKDFVATMWEFATRGKARRDPLTSADYELLREAMYIRRELDTYHGRAMFDDKNLEDILSLLSFDEMSGGSQSRKKLSTFVKAISRTIELTCRVVPEITDQCVGPYYSFWLTLLTRLAKNKSLPTIITFNYDLVLERSLCHALDGDYFRSIEKERPFDGLSIMYYYDKLQKVNLILQRSECTDGKAAGTRPWMGDFGECKEVAEIEILKLHGSLNFSTNGTTQPNSPVQAVEDPLILPPIFNKMDYVESLNNAWAKALQRLRKTKNVFIVGYSLPSTDIYMQYFLKAGLGPNTDLNRVFVYDPVLFKEGDGRNDMVHRYKTCFSPQLQKSIEFNPYGGDNYQGSLYHFVTTLSNVLF
jgi:hypothetical protein